ncbi:MAG: DUF1653 domain-containing protein [Zavarzinella sp.]
MTTPPGRCRHYKGIEYPALGKVRHCETQEVLVPYRQWADFCRLGKEFRP